MRRHATSPLDLGHDPLFFPTDGVDFCQKAANPSRPSDVLKKDTVQSDPLNTCSDEELLAQFCLGQADAFGTLVKRYER